MNRNTRFLVVGLGLIGGAYARRLTAMGYAVDALEDEYRHCVTQMGFTGEDLRTMARYALDAAFLPEAEKREIAGKF